MPNIGDNESDRGLVYDLQAPSPSCREFSFLSQISKPHFHCQIHQLIRTMYSKLFSIAALVSAASAQGQGLAAVLAGNQETSQLASLVGTLPDVAGQLSSLQNITLLAPSNAALAALLNSSVGASLSSNPGLLQAV